MLFTSKNCARLNRIASFNCLSRTRLITPFHSCIHTVPQSSNALTLPIRIILGSILGQWRSNFGLRFSSAPPPQKVSGIVPENKPLPFHFSSFHFIDINCVYIVPLISTRCSKRHSFKLKTDLHMAETFGFSMPRAIDLIRIH
jgi:hypothetical protein